ncbi:MAG: hypothetical protein LBU64_02720 [Planctomycetota bacterium]|nr:hypothetical protein [Planctomycetota bacterium]
MGFTFDDISKAKISAFTKEAGIRVGRIAVPDFPRGLNVADAARVKNAGASSSSPRMRIGTSPRPR